MADRIKGITVEIGGDVTKLNDALRDVNKEINSTQSQLKDVERLLKLDPTNTTLLAQKQQLLGQEVQNTEKKLQTLREAASNADAALERKANFDAKYKPLQEEVDSTSKTLDGLRDNQKRMEEDFAAGKISTESYEKFQAKISETEQHLKTLKQQQKDVETEFAGAKMDQGGYDALQREIIETEQKLKDLQEQAAKSNAVLQQISAVGEKFQEAGEAIEGAGKKLLPVTGAVAALGTAAVATAADFDAAMAQVAAVSGATGDDLDDLRAKAREMGSKTKFSASEAAEAMNYMAMAGWKTEDMLSGIEGIMNLAAASGEDLATTSDIVTDALTAFGLTAADSGHFADILAAASSNANTNVSMMGESFKYVAPVAGALGYSAEDVSIMLGLMANSGIKASQAGTSLRSSLTNLSSPTKAMVDVMVSLGLATEETATILDSDKIAKAQNKVENRTLDLEKAQIKYDDAVAKYGKKSSQAEQAAMNLSKAQNNLEDAITDLNKAQRGEVKTVGISNNLLVDSSGNMRSLSEVAQILREKFAGLSQEEQAQAASTLFGKEAMSGMLAIINASEADFNGLADAIAVCSDTVDGYNGVTEQMAAVMQDNLSGQMTILKSQLEELAISFGEMLMPVIRSVVSAVQAFVDKLNSMDEGTRQTIITVLAIAAALGPLLIVIGKVISSVGTIMTILPKLSGVIGALTNPVGLVIAAIAGIIAILVVLWNNCEEFRDAVTAAFTTIMEAAKTTFQGVQDAIATALDAVVSALDAVCTFFTGLWSDIKSVFQTVASWFNDTVAQPVIQLFRGVWEAVSGFFTNLWNDIVNAYHTVIDPWIEIVRRLSVIIRDEVIVPIQNFFQELWDKIVTIFTPIAQWFKTTFTAAWTAIQTAWSGVTEWFSGVWSGITGVFNAAGEWFSGIFTSAREGIKSAFGTVGEFFAGIWAGIQGTFSHVTDWFKNVFAEAWTAVKNVFSTGGEIFTGIVDGILSGFKAVVNGIIGGLNKVIKIPFDGINAALSKIKNIDILGVKPFDWISTISIPQIPMLWKGGILESGNAIVGERGPELLSLMNGKARVTPLTDNGGGQRITAPAAATGFNQTINISAVAMSPAEVARQTRNATRQMLAKARG